MSSTSFGERVVKSCNEPDYSAVDLPSKDQTAYSYVERRAELLQLVEEVAIPQH